MIAIASKEIYRLDIKINVNGDKESSNKVKKVEETAEKAKKKLKDLGNQTASPTAKLNDKMSSPLDKLESKTKKLSDRTISPTAKLKDNATSGLDKVKSATEKLNNKEAKVKVKAEDQASSVIEKANNKLTSWLKAGSKKVISIALAGTLAMGGFGATTAINTFSNFEYGMKTVQATSQATEADLSKLTNTAKNLGATTSFSAVEVSQGMNYLAMAGYKTNDIISAMPGLLNAAAASGEDLASTSDIISDAITAFGMKASDTNHLSDVMAQASANANTNIGLLGESFKYVGATMGAMKYSIEDTSIALGLMANAGVKGSMGGTSLKNAIVNMVSPTKTMAAVMEKYKLSLTDSEGNMKSLKGVMDMLREKMGGLDTATQAAAASDLFGKEAMSGMLAIINAGTSDYDKLTTAIYGADGAAKKMADTKLDSLSGQWTILKSAVEGMNIALGERLAPYAKQFVTWFTGKIPDITDCIVNTVDYLSNHTEDIKETAIAIGTVVTAIAGFNIAGSIGNSISGISNLVSLFKGASVAKDATETAVGISKVGLAAKILPALFSPVGLAITAGVATTAYGVMSYNSLINRSIDTATEELTIGEKIINKFTGSAYKSAKELQESGVKYTDFGEGISDSFKKAVRETAKSGTELLMNIKKIDMSGYSTSDRENKIANRINDYAYDIINALENKKNSETKVLKDALSADGDYSSENDSAVSSIGEYYDNVTEKIQVARDKVYYITSQAYADNRELAVSELEEIKGYIDQMNSLKLDAIDAKNTYDQAYAQSKFTTDASKITDTDSASELLKSSYKDIDDAYKDKIADLDGHIAVLEKTLSETTEESKKSSLEKSIDELRNTRGSYADSNWNEKQAMYQIIMDQNPGAASSINKYTGDKLDKVDLNRRETLDKMQEKTPGLTGIKESGVYALRNEKNGRLERYAVVVNELSKEIVGVKNLLNGETGLYSTEDEQILEKVSENYKDINSTLSKISGNKPTHILETYSGTYALKDVMGKTLDALQDVRVAEDGVIEGFATIDGTQVYIKADASGVIQAIGNTREELNQVPPITAADVTTNGTAQKTTSEITGVITKANEADGKTITITTIFKKVSQWFKDKFSGAADAISENANGTHYSESGLSTVDERGWELADRTVPVIGQYNNNPLVNLQKGTKIRNHMNSVNDMRAAVQQEVARKTPQQKVEVYQPQVAMAGGGNQFSFGGMNININGNQDVEAMIQEAMQQFGQNLRDAFTNIQK